MIVNFNKQFSIVFLRLVDASDGTSFSITANIHDIYETLDDETMGDESLWTNQLGMDKWGMNQWRMNQWG